MPEPPSPVALRWFTPLTVVAAVAAAMLATALAAALLLGDWPLMASPLWSLGFTVVAVLVLAALAVSVKNALVREIKAHIDMRVYEIAGRMDRRMNILGNAMAEHGVKLDEVTGEIPRVRQAVENHSHPVQLSGYDQGYADGAAGRPIAAKMRVIGRT